MVTNLVAYGKKKKKSVLKVIISTNNTYVTNLVTYDRV